jgi:Domain of unknown function (DUF5979)/Thioester domain
VTRAGLGYYLGSWEASGMPNVGYVARLLTDYYPHTPGQPSGLGSNDQRAAAVQAAIWFFTDRFVVSTTGTGSNLRSTVVSIVNTVVSQGPLLTPPPPSLTITPTHESGHVDVLGPFTVTSNHPPVTVTATGGTMYSNPAGTIPLGNGTTHTESSGHLQIWLRRSAGNPTGIVILHATSTAVVPSGNVYLYDGNTPGTLDAQRVILAAPATLTTTVQATGEFKPYGKLIVKKTIDGPAAHERGEVRIRVKCDDGVSRPDFVIPPGSSERERTYDNIPAGTECSVTEISNGSSTTVVHEVTGNGQEDPAVPATGILTVVKHITGPAARQHGPIAILVSCGGTLEDFTFDIPAGTGTGSLTHHFDDIPTGVGCTVTETADGGTSRVSAAVTGSGHTVTIPAAGTVTVHITDRFTIRTAPPPPPAVTG